MNANLISLAERVVLAGANLLLQSTLLILAGLLIAWLCRRRGPALESVILRTTLVAVILCPVVSVLLTRMGIAGRSLVLPAVKPGAIAPAVLASGPVTMPAAAPVTLSPAPAMTATAGPVGRATEGTKAMQGAPQNAISTMPPVRVEEGGTVTSLAGSFGIKAISGVALAYLLAAALWVGGGGFLLARLLVSYRSIARMLRESDLAAVGVFENCSAIARELAVASPEVRVHSEIKSPLLIGLVRPAILLPHVEGMEDLVATREVLLHELAHRVRGDCGWHLLSRAVTALLWFQPLLWLLARRTEETAEDVCDNYVIEHAGDRRGYAQQLVALAEQLQFSSAESLAGTGVIAYRSALGQRVVRILDASRNLSRRVNLPAAAGVVMTGLLASATAGLIGVKAAEAISGPVAGATLRVVSAGARWQEYGTLSPDEAKIAYIDWEAPEDANLMLMNLATGRTDNLTKADPSDSHYDFVNSSAIWSPDSKSVAYVWFEDKEKRSHLRITSVVDGSHRIVAEKAQNYLEPVDWSRDGKNLLCVESHADKTDTLVLVAVESGDIRQILSFEWNRASHLRFSPDGRAVVFDRMVDGNRDVYLVEIGGHEIHRLTNAPSRETGPTFSVDGKFVLFSSDQRGSVDLWAVEIAHGNPVGSPFVVRPGFGEAEKRLSQAGDLIFTATHSETDGYEVELQKSGPRHLSAPRPIALSHRGHNWSPTWSPDGTRVAFIRDRNMLAVQSLANGGEEVFPAGGMWWMSNIMWSPDGKSMVVYPRGPKETGLHVYNMATRELRDFGLPRLGNITFSGWSADGREFQFVRYAGKEVRFEALDIETGTRREITPGPGVKQIGYFDVSPDGTRIVYAARPTSGAEVELIVADRQLTREQVIARLGAYPKFDEGSVHQPRPHWSPDGTCIAYFRDDTLWSDGNIIIERRLSLHVVAADGSWDEQVDTGALKHTAYSQKPAEWSKDGTKLAMTLEGQDRGEIGVLTNFLPNQAVAKAAAAPPAPVRGAATTQILATGNDDSVYGTLSPDETMIAYVADDADADGNLMVKTLSDGKSRKVTTSGYRIMPDVYEFVDSEIVWSPDSTSVAYKWVAGTQADSSGETRLTSPTRGELRISSVADGKMRVLIPKNPEIEYEPLDWSADGRTLLCGMERRDFSTALALVSVESGEMRQLLSLEWNRVNHARLSPDGRFIAFDRTVDGNQDIYVLEVGGNRLIRITDSPGSETGPVWSADGRTLLYSSDQRGMWDLWGTRMADGKPMGTPFVIRPAFGNPKKRLTRTGNLAFETSIGALDGYAIDVNLDGPKHLGAPKPIARSFLGRNASPTWSPDGSRVAQIRDWNLLAIQNVATGAEEVVNPGMRYMNNIYWSPDPKWIALYPAGPRLNGVHAFNVETHELRPIWDLNERPQEKNYRPMGWTADGKEFLALAERGSDLIAIRIADGQRRHVTIGEGKAVGYFAPSPDGRSVAFMSQEGQPALLVADREMKEIRPLAKLGAAPNLAPNRAVDPRVRNGIGARPSWSPDGRAIAHFVGKELHVTAADGGWDEKVDNGKLGPSPYTWKSPAWSSDGRKVAITLRGEGRAEIGLLKNFLPTEMVAAK